MKLDRNTNPDGTGKYALVLMREIPPKHPASAELRRRIEDALQTLEECGVLDYGAEGSNSEFFVLRLKDEGAATALHAYSMFFRNIDPQWSEEVWGLSNKAFNHPNKKRPD